MPQPDSQRLLRSYALDTGRDFDQFRSDWEAAVPMFSRDDAIAVVAAGGEWAAIEQLSAATAIHGFVNFFAFDPSPVMRLAGHTRRAVTYLTSSIPLGESVFRRDPAAIQYAPLRMTIAERPDANAVLVFDNPLDLFATDPALAAAAVVFQTRLVSLLSYLDLPVPDSLRTPGRG